MGEQNLRKRGRQSGAAIAANVIAAMVLALCGAALVYLFDAPAWACVMTWAILYPVFFGKES